ncbi:zinc finger BED domain-containing protein 1-like [Rhizophagus clarus]|uniref:Zinc finger BED domain-containing protein 1-like n=1 Tax=Rhizophagus clarus TaxID=94130 RepID=A0A8H3L8M8_9GLOM|nr:zinc finger BED domain-containing protein 1-like [Rhizophagus clarus]
MDHLVILVSESQHGILRSEKEKNNNLVRSKIDAAFLKTVGKNPKRKQERDEALAEFLIDNMQPLYTLKSAGFINLFKTLDSYYNLSSDKYIKQLVTKACDYSERELLTLFKDTVQSQLIYGPLEIVKVISAFINKEFELQEIMLACQYLEYPHTSKNIAQTLLNLISEWQNERMKAIQIHHHLNETENFSKNHKYMRIIQDVKTRWNSSYLAWEDTKKDLKRLKEIMHSDDEWKLMQQLTKLLQPLYDATKLLSGEKYATATFIYYVVASLQAKVIPKEIEMVDLTNNDNAFDDVEFEDGNDDDVVIMNESQTKREKLKLKIL